MKNKMLKKWKKQVDFYYQLDTYEPENDYFNDVDIEKLCNFIDKQLFALDLGISHYYNKNDEWPELFKLFSRIKNRYLKSKLLNISHTDAQILYELSAASSIVIELLKSDLKETAEPYKYHIQAILDTCKFINNKVKGFHHEICECLKKQVIRGEEVYAFIDSYDPSVMESPYFSPFINAVDNAEELVDHLYCSIITTKMIEYDNLMFDILRESEDSGEIFYRPYYSGFVIHVDKYGRAVGKLGDDEAFEALRSELIANQNRQVWFKAYFINDGSRYEGEGEPYVKGDLLFAASAMTESNGKLVLKKLYPDDNKVTDDYKNLLNSYIYNDVAIHDLIYNNIGNVKKSLIYNIGHGNFITFEDSRGTTKIIYDIGLSYRKSYAAVGNEYKRTYKKIKNISSELVIISHWDEDHYAGAYINEKNIFNIPWIVTACKAEKGKTNAKRIMLYLDSIKKLYMIKRAIDDSSVSGKQLVAATNNNGRYFGLYRGEGTSSGITEDNRYGLALNIKYIYTNTLMCADVPYRCLPDSIIDNKYYDYVVIPHHASDMVKSSYKKLETMSGIEYSFICVKDTETLGKTGVLVKDGDHFKSIDKMTNKEVYFTDDDKHSVFAYSCDLSKNDPPIIIPK